MTRITKTMSDTIRTAEDLHDALATGSLGGLSDRVATVPMPGEDGYDE